MLVKLTTTTNRTKILLKQIAKWLGITLLVILGIALLVGLIPLST